MWLRLSSFQLELGDVRVIFNDLFIFDPGYQHSRGALGGHVRPGDWPLHTDLADAFRRGDPNRLQ